MKVEIFYDFFCNFAAVKLKLQIIINQIDS